MTLIILTVIFGTALLMGGAIQRSTLCAVLATSELIRHRRADRFIGFIEAGLWSGLAAVSLSGLVFVQDWAPWLWLVIGSALFGAGAAINGACVFGVVARIGEGRMDFVISVVAAVLAGYLVAAVNLAQPMAFRTEEAATGHGLWLLLAMAVAMGVRAAVRRRKLRSFLTISLYMGIIGAGGAIIGLLHQPWPWLRALLEIAGLPLASAIALLGLFAGAIGNGLMQGRFKFEATLFSVLPSRIIGGALMGAGAVIVPGGNDLYVLQALPAGDIHGLVAYAVMIAAIAGWLTVFGGVRPVAHPAM